MTDEERAHNIVSRIRSWDLPWDLDRAEEAIAKALKEIRVEYELKIAHLELKAANAEIARIEQRIKHWSMQPLKLKGKD